MTGFMEEMDWVPLLDFCFFSDCCNDDVDDVFLTDLVETMEDFFLLSDLSS